MDTIDHALVLSAWLCVCGIGMLAFLGLVHLVLGARDWIYQRTH